MDGGPAHTAANQEPCPPTTPVKKTIQSTLRSNIFGHICWSCAHFPLQKTIQSALRGKILGRMSGPREHFPLQKTIQSDWIMRGHPAITVKLFLTWTAGVLAYGLVCAGPPDTMMATRRDCALVFDTDGGGRHVSRCVLSRARAHLAHAARAPHMARLARLEHAVHLAHVEHVAHLARQACLARLGPSVARTGSVLIPSSCPSKDGR